MSTQNYENQMPYMTPEVSLYWAREVEEEHLLRQEALHELSNGVGMEKPELFISNERLREQMAIIKKRRKELTDKG